eukprot:TRINITY_DN5185_c0_g1_i2.p1 TRINITY_DN5185_c0_g1~~TRINITY_DN5185_c0_g1_i2.p1  ORF type:complete len:129 (+),score=8.25 TRINITY_DN5185_c0_g1_i2:482-868(+)
MCRSRILGAPHLTRPNSVLAQFLRHSFPEAHAQSAAEHTAREAQREADAALHGGTQEAQGGQTAPGDPQRGESPGLSSLFESPLVKHALNALAGHRGSPVRVRTCGGALVMAHGGSGVCVRHGHPGPD